MSISNIIARRRHVGGLSASVGLAVLAVCLMGAVSPQAAQAATPTATGITSVNGAIGSVDLQKVLNGYTKKSTADAAMKTQVDAYTSVFNMQKSDMMLSEADQQSLGALLLKATPTPADQAQIQALQTRSQADYSELTALQQKANLTPADTTRLAALTKEQQQGQQALQDIHDSYTQLLDQKNQAEADLLAADVKSAVAAVAQERNLAVVFDSSLAIYASNDVTQLVINHLNAAK